MRALRLASLSLILLALPALALPSRVVVLSPSLGEMVYSLGGGPRLVGSVEGGSWNELLRGLPSVGAYHRPNLEAIVALSPDLVVGEPIHTPVLRRLGEMGFRVLELDLSSSLEGLYRAYEELGRALGLEDRALSEVDKVRKALSDLRGALRERPSCLVMVWHNPIVVAGPRSFLFDLLEGAGLDCAAKDLPPGYPTISREALISLRPDLVLVPISHGSERVGDEMRRLLEGLLGRVRVLEVDPDVLFRPGPRALELLELLRKELVGGTPR